MSANGVTFVDVVGATTPRGATSANLARKWTGADSGYSFEAVFSNPSGTITTTAATLTVSFQPCGRKNHPHPGSNLSGCDRTGVDFSGVDLSHANLENANLANAVLTKAVLEYARLEGVNLSGANLVDADLTGARLTGAGFTGADLTGANLTGAILTGVWWSNTTCPDGTDSDSHGDTCANNL